MSYLIPIAIGIQHSKKEKEQVRLCKLFCHRSLAVIVPLSGDIADKTIELRKKHKKLSLGHAIIAATASVNDYILITRNIADFKNIPGLKQINPHDL